MTKLGITEGYSYFDPHVAAHIVDAKAMADDHVPGFWSLCGRRLAYLRDEAELLEARHKEHHIQKLCKQCMKRNEGTVRVASPAPPQGPYNMEIVYRGEWVHLGTVGNMDSNDLEWVAGYRTLCLGVVDKLLKGQKS